MVLGRKKRSFAAGAAAAVVCVAAWKLLPGVPLTVQRHAPAKGAWLWSPREMAWTVVPYARPLREPQLRRANDGAILVAEAYDRDREVQRFDAGGRFVPDAAPPAEETPPTPPGGTKLVRVAGGGWIARAEDKKTSPAPTHILRDHKWGPGPALPVGYWLGLTAALEGGGWAGYCENPYGDGPLGICSARERDKTFRKVPVPKIGPMLPSGESASNWVVAPARGREVLVVSAEDDGPVRMLLVDIETGVVREGPAAPRPFSSTRFARGPVGEYCPSGCGGAT